MSAKPLCIDLFCGLGGWSDGFLATGWDCIGFDIEQHAYGDDRYPGQLVIQDVLTLRGDQFRSADCIVASPPCQFFSYVAMPWTRAKTLAAAVRADPARLEKELALFNACFRIQREACEAAGRHIPLVVENVRGAIPWVGRSRANFGSFHLWGDVPALMPSPSAAVKHPGMDWNGHPAGSKPINPNYKPVAFNDARHDLGHKVPGFRFDGSGGSFQTAAVEGMKSNGDIPHIRTGARSTPHLTNSAEHAPEGTKHGGDWFSDPTSPSRQGGQHKVVAEGRKGAGAGAEWFDGNLCVKSSKSSARKAASAKIAKIPPVLAHYIGKHYLPR